MTSPRREKADHLTASSAAVAITVAIVMAMMMRGTTVSLIMNVIVGTAQIMMKMLGRFFKII